MSAKSIVESGFSMPRIAPLYEAPPYLFRSNRNASILFRTTPETLRRLVPPPLIPNSDSLLFIYIAQFHVVAPQLFDYQEAGVGVPVSFSGMAGQYAVYLYLDQAGPIVAGREVYGWPKKDAEISFTEEDEMVSAQIVREGVTLIDATVRRSERVDPVPKEPPIPWFNLKCIPSVKKNSPPDVLQLTSTLTEGETRELYTGAATLRLGSSSSDPLGDIPIVAVLGGRYTIGDFTLGYGDVIYDYLAESA